MDTQMKNRLTTVLVDDDVQLSLERDPVAGMRILIRPGSGKVPRFTPIPVTQDPDDDLANATWEDAEWR